MRSIARSFRRFLWACVAFGCGFSWVAGAGVPAIEPDLSLSLRGVWGGTIEAGESIRVAVRVDLPADATAKLTLAPAKGSWIEATTVEILSAGGQVVPAAARAAVMDAERVTLVDADNPASGLWWFPADVLGAVVPGDYLVRARLVIRDGSGWKGEVVSDPAQLRVVATSSDPERVLQRSLARAHAAILEDAPAKAAEILDAILETNPDSVPVLALRAALSLHGGNRTAARICLNRARVLAARLGGEPSVELNELSTRLELAMADGTAVAELPSWTRPPRSVFEPLRPAQTDSSVRAQEIPVTPRPTVASANVPVVPAVPVFSPAKAASDVKPAAHATGVHAPGVVVPSPELNDGEIAADPAGQWAVTATAGTQYGKTQYSAAQATGAPNVGIVGNSPDAWCPASKTDGVDWLEVGFAKPVYATEVRIRQNDAAGAIVKVEAIEPDGTAHVWWEGVDPYKAPAVREIVWFAARVPTTGYLVAKVKITLNLASGPGYKEIDAVQLVGTEPGRD
jgi:hypothetical protein